MNPSKKSEYGEILTRIIKEKNMTQEYFYTNLGITKPYFYDIIRGKTNQSTATWYTDKNNKNFGTTKNR